MKEHNKYYWEGKKHRADVAKMHTEEMERAYFSDIQSSINRTKVYSGRFWENSDVQNYENVRMSVKETDTISALLDCTPNDGRVAVLNFASYKHPGGGFMIGSRAQEESLCHESFLYNVLSHFDGTYYEENRNDLNRGLYRDRALYSPDVYFVRGNNVAVCDVLTCAAPNFSAAGHHVTRGNNNKALAERVRFILEIAKKEKVDTFIVGAWGCGVFQQDPNALAKCFDAECQKVFTDAKIHLIFAVIPPLPHQTDNLTPFVKLVDNWNSTGGY